MSYKDKTLKKCLVCEQETASQNRLCSGLCEKTFINSPKTVVDVDYKLCVRCGNVFTKKSLQKTLSKRNFLGRKYCSRACVFPSKVSGNCVVCEKHVGTSRFRGSIICGKRCYREYLQQSISRNFAAAIVRGAKEREMRRKNVRPFDIDKEYVESLLKSQEGRCAVSGLKMAGVGEDEADGYAQIRSLKKVSLDRIDNSEGYVKGNVQLVCMGINYMMNNFPMDEVEEFLKAVVDSRIEMRERDG